MLAAHQPVSALQQEQCVVPDSPLSGSLEFPQRQPAASSSEEAANAALLANGTRSDVRLQAVLIPPSADDHAESKQNKPAASGKKRFSLDGLRLPFNLARKTSSTNPLEEEVEAENHPIIPPRSVMPSANSPSRVARASSLHRVSFSPSTEEAAQAREQALELATEKDRKADLKKKKEEKLQHKSNNKLRGLKSFSTGNLHDVTHFASRDTVETTMSASSGGHRRFLFAASSPHKRFAWDKKGIRTSKSKPAKVKISKQQAVAARHAKTLEQVINAGMGLHAVPKRDSSLSKTKGAVSVVSQSQLKGLKSALMDVQLANGIIGELRAMQIPLPADNTEGVHVGTAGEHGEERVIAAPIPEQLRPKDDLAVPPMMARRKSAAEDMLRKMDRKINEAETTKHKGHHIIPVQKRVSSLANETALIVQPKVVAPAHATRPVRAVCLDCGEYEAHRRHAEQDTPINKPAVAGGIATAGVAALGIGFFAKQEKEEPIATAQHQMEHSQSSPSLPTLADGKALLGSKPVQLMISPAPAIIGASGEMSGAFDALAGLSGAAVRATTDMDSTHPPLDRVAIFVHWWGFELTLPRPTMQYLSTAHSVGGAFLSFLQTMAVTGGVPELLPFIRYISMYMDVEFKAIQAQDKGNGVCVAATWFMPLALVPRPWDYIAEQPSGMPLQIPRAPFPAELTSVPKDGSLCLN